METIKGRSCIACSGLVLLGSMGHAGTMFPFRFPVFIVLDLE